MASNYDHLERPLDILNGVVFADDYASAPEPAAEVVPYASAVPAYDKQVAVLRDERGNITGLAQPHHTSQPYGPTPFSSGDGSVKLVKTVETKTTIVLPPGVNLTSTAVGELLASDYHSAQTLPHQQASRTSMFRRLRSLSGGEASSSSKWKYRALFWAAASLVAFEATFAVNNGELGTPQTVAQAHFGLPSASRIVGFIAKGGF